jgi:membrane associated rhomboid family serine protease
MPRYDDYDVRFPPIPPVTRNLMIACAVIFVLELIPRVGPLLLYFGELFPPMSPAFWPWQVVTYAFLHMPNDPSHLIFNMLGLFMFGVSLEQLWGPKRYLMLLGASTVVAGLVHVVVSLLMHGYAAPLIGASGAVFGLLMAQALIAPHRPTLFFMVLPMENRTAVAIFGALELVLGVSRDGVAHFAHLGGMLGAYLIITWWRRGGGSGGGARKKTPLRRVH